MAKSPSHPSRGSVSAATLPDPAGGDRREETFRQLLRTTSSVRAKMEEHFEEFGLSGSQWGVLRVVHRAERNGEEGVGLGDLVKRMLVTPPAITGVVNRLERANLVVRRVTTSDRRARVVSLTETGRKLVARVLERHRHRVHRVMAGLTNEDIEHLSRLLKQLNHHVAEMPQGFQL